jgi:hypothetical protein
VPKAHWNRRENLLEIVSTDHARPRIRHYEITTELKTLLNTKAGLVASSKRLANPGSASTSSGFVRSNERRAGGNPALLDPHLERSVTVKLVHIPG